MESSKESESSSCCCDEREFANNEIYCRSDACYVCRDGRWEVNSRLSVL